MNKTPDAMPSRSDLPDPERLCDFREANLGDLGSIMDIERNSFPEPWPRSVFVVEICGRSWSRVIVALRDGVLVGYMVYWTVISEVHLLNLAVAPKWRCKGVGRELMRHLIETGRQEDVSEILLEVRQSNRIAQRLYRSFHFEEIAVRPRYYADNGEDALVLLRTLR